MDLTPEKRRILYRAMHRGFKEADLIIGHFAKQHLHDMAETELEEFVRLLEVPDQELYGWLIGRHNVPENHDGPIFRRLKAFDLPKHLMKS